MNIAFIGTTSFGLRCLKALQQLAECRVVGVVAAPPTFSISYRPAGVRNVLHADMAAYCAEATLPCEILEGRMDEELLAKVAAWNPDAFVVAGWYHMVPKSWRQLAPAYGLHASLLPDYRGGAPLVWAMINGEPKTGISLFQLGDGVDDGPLVGQAETKILPDDTIATLYGRIESLGVKLLETYIPRLADGTAVLVPQDLETGRIFPQRGPEDGRIDWSLPAAKLYDFIRAQTRPYPGAFTQVGGRKLTVWSSRTGDSKRELVAGEFACEDDRLVVGTGDGLLELLDISLDGVAIKPGDLGEKLGSKGRFVAAVASPIDV